MTATKRMKDMEDMQDMQDMAAWLSPIWQSKMVIEPDLTNTNLDLTTYEMKVFNEKKMNLRNYSDCKVDLSNKHDQDESQFYLPNWEFT